jgi:hypothetical protein
LRRPRAPHANYPKIEGGLKMQGKRTGTKAIVLSLVAVFATMAVAVTGAQAGKGDYVIVSKMVLANESESIKVKSEESGALLIPDLSLTIICSSYVLHGKILFLGTAHLEGTFSSCGVYTAKLNLMEMCVLDDIQVEGLALVDGADTVLLIPPTGKAFGNLKFSSNEEKEEECALEAEVPVSGTLLVLITSNNQVKILAKAAAAQGTDGLLFTGFATTVHNGASTGELIGLKTGEKWGIQGL